MISRIYLNKEKSEPNFKIHFSFSFQKYILHFYEHLTILHIKKKNFSNQNCDKTDYKVISG